MKKDFTYLTRWLITLFAANILWAFLIGFVETLCKLLFSSPTVYCLFTWVIGTAVICTALAITAYNVGIQLNGKSKPLSLDGPALNQVIGVIIYIAVFWITKGTFVLGPNTYMLSYTLSGTNPQAHIAPDPPLSTLVWLCVLQVLIYAAASMAAYISAKNKQDHHNETVRKLREERQKAEAAAGGDR